MEPGGGESRESGDDPEDTASPTPFSDEALEEELLEAGNKLLNPPSSVEELLSLLDQVEGCLSRVEQSPSKSMQNALSLSLKALIDDKLLRHSDPDVKVAVASCISEITRITAPEAPYDDDQMKEAFQLIVSSFENLHDMSSRSYAKRIVILEIVSRIRSCMIMLDLECDSLILKMFQHFLRAIREHHPGNVFSYMETIMTLVLEESEDISLDLLSTLLASIKKDNEEVLPVARKLGARVLGSCATKLKPYLVDAVKTLGISVDDYIMVVASICQDTSDGLKKNDVCVTSEHVEDNSKSKKQSPEDSAQVVKEGAKEATPFHEGDKQVDVENVSKLSEGASDLEAEHVGRSVKTALKKTTVVDSVNNESGAASDAGVRKRSAKKLDENKGGGRSSSRQMEERKKRGQGKANSEDARKSSAINVDKESDTKEYAENLVGLRIEVWWPKDREFYKGVIHSFDSTKNKHKVLYDDGDREMLNLVKEKWNVIEADDDEDVEEEEGGDRASLDASTDMLPKKRRKTNSGESTKQGKTNASSRSRGAAASSRSKGESTRSSHKSKEGNKPKDSKTISKSGDEVSRKSQGSTPKSGGGKSIAAAQKMSSKSKDDDYLPKPSAKSKKETSKSGKSKQVTLKTSASKGKPPNSGGKSVANSTGKVKSGSLKMKDSDSEDENSDVSAREVEDTKGKVSSSSKTRGSEAKPPKSGVKSVASSTGKVKSGSLKRKDSADENSDVSAKNVEDTKGKGSNSSKAQGNEAKSGKKRRRR